MWLLLVLMYVAVAVFVVVVARKTYRYATAPMHLRWELYPVPHEVGRDYGGSYLEESDWWTRTRHTSRLRELAAMVPEMVFIVGLWHHNRPMWYLSFPFHGGLYVCIGFVGLLVLQALLGLAGMAVATSPDPLVGTLRALTTLVGVVGMLSVCVGCLGLLVKRLRDPQLRAYSVPADYFNLALIFAIALCGLLTWQADPAFQSLRAFVQGFLTLNPPATMPAAAVLAVALFALFLVYLPFTHMTHFVGKWFTYHTVRWDDEPNHDGSKYAVQLASLLNRPVGWMAPHVGGGTWAEVATREVRQ